MTLSVGHLETRFGEGKMAFETTTCTRISPAWQPEIARAMAKRTAPQFLISALGCFCRDISWSRLGLHDQADLC